MMKNFSLLSVFTIFLFLGHVQAQEDPCNAGRTFYDLEEALKVPQDVKVLDIAMQDPKLTSLPPEIGLLINLECLDVSFNRLSDLPAELAELKKLKVLDLSGNRYMGKLPKVLLNMPSLLQVDLTSKPEWSKEKCDEAKAALPNATVLTDK